MAKVETDGELVEILEGEIVEGGDNIAELVEHLKSYQGEQLAAATHYLANMMNELGDQQRGPCEIDNDEQLLELWLNPERGQFSNNTRNAYRRDVGQALEHIDRPIGEVTKRDVLEWKAALAEDYALSTAGRKLAAFKSLLDFAASENYTPMNVAHNVATSYKSSGAGDQIADKVKAEHRRTKRAQGRLSEGEVFTMFAQARGRNRLMLRTCYYMGLRATELVGLRWGDFEPHPDDPNKRVVEIQGKGGKVRPVPVRADLWRELADSRPDGAGPDGLVFRSRKGGELSRQQVYRIIRKSAERAGIDTNQRPVSPHWLRRACGAHLADRGCPMHRIRDLLGHASVTTTDGYTPSDPTEGVTDLLPG